MLIFAQNIGCIIGIGCFNNRLHTVSV